MKNTTTTKHFPRVFYMLAVLIVGAALAAYAQQYIESLKIGGGSGDSGIDLNANGTIQMDGDLVIREKADHTETPGAGFGYLWVKNTSPSTLVFTDDAGTDTTLGSGGSGITELTGDVTAGPGSGSQAATIAAGAVDMAMINATGTASGTTYLRGDGAWATPAGSGDVSKVGTPADGQVGVWTGDGTIEGDAALTFDTTDDTLVIGASGKLAFGAVDVLTDSAGTTTLQNIDAIDATTESTVEAAIDTLANLTSIQGQSFTVTGTTSITGTNTGDQDISSLTTGPGATVTDNAVARFDGTGGLTIQESPVTIADTTGNMAGVGTLNTHTIPGGTGTFALTSDLHSAVTVSGTPDYITLSGQDIVRGLVDVTTDITGTLPIANGGTGATTLDGASIPTYTSTSTLTNKRITSRTGSTASSATPTINTDNVDHYLLTAQAADITSFTTNLSGTPTEGQRLLITITGTAARAITWGASFEAGAVALPTTTITTQRLDVLFIWNTATSKWRCMAAGPLS